MEWISVYDRLPETEDEVLVVKAMKNGRRQVGLGYCISDYQYQYLDPVTGAMKMSSKGPYWVCHGSNNVVYWMPVPELPKEEK